MTSLKIKGQTLSQQCYQRCFSRRGRNRAF